MRTQFLFIFTLWAVVFCFDARARPASGGGSSGSRGFGSALGEGNTSFGLIGGIVNSTQDSLNDMQARANVREGGITTSTLTQAYEFGVTFTYRYTGTIYALQFRPSYFYERQDGQGASGSFTYSVTGFTFFPLLRIYPMENDIMKIFMHAGIGYGQLKGAINEGQSGGVDRHVDFSSGAFGTVVGIGTEFAYSTTHTFSLEVNYRYLTFIRNVASTASGTWASNSLSQGQKGLEVELDGNDLAVNMGGLMFLVGYNYYF